MGSIVVLYEVLKLLTRELFVLYLYIVNLRGKVKFLTGGIAREPRANAHLGNIG
jgi:hypothetical protein